MGSFSRHLRRGLALAAVAVGLAAAAAPAKAAGSIEARIDISDQRMIVYVDGIPRHDWAVSTARPGYRTPVGIYRPLRLHKMWYSRKYEMSPMPYSVFFHGGYAIHGTNYVKRLGAPASHGCVRLAPENARLFFDLVSESGAGQTRIVIGP
ncbi:L,D-transpeptidase [Prosthecomicrobium pneumaticum]|uniref:Lipoprotein-anchoring transpeptidase ErfK/SrfK n=1 Tax=Prosthecomicrobium pneumaticum TaxID=81895 RepID=A0A7W9CT26_9HYPH|nr:L,D-transpeptidase [Prosthecomicrobium pneumaticum]MBB5751129.1 lipoprotein-anchoring transpeptidase ErfK/SrfK [Prosthecomicrobium pneumaticum]